MGIALRTAPPPAPSQHHTHPHAAPLPLLSTCMPALLFWYGCAVYSLMGMSLWEAFALTSFWGTLIINLFLYIRRAVTESSQIIYLHVVPHRPELCKTVFLCFKRLAQP